MLTKGLVTPDASFLAICSRSFSMRIYSLSPDYSTSPPTVTPVLQRSVKAHTAPVIIADTDPTGTLLATGGADGLVKVWDIKGGFVTHNLRGHGGVISAMKFYRPDSTARKGGKGKKNSGGSGWRLATGADDAAVRVWDLEESKCLAVLDSHVSVVRGLDWSRDGRTLVSGSRDQVVCIWDTKRWKLKGTIPVLEELEVVGFLAPGVLNAKVEGQVLYMGGRRNRVRLWDLAGGKEVTQIEDDEHDYGERGAEGIVDIMFARLYLITLGLPTDHTLDTTRPFTPLFPSTMTKRFSRTLYPSNLPLQPPYRYSAASLVTTMKSSTSSILLRHHHSLRLPQTLKMCASCPLTIPSVTSVSCVVMAIL